MNEYAYEMWDDPSAHIPNVSVNMPPNFWAQAKTLRERAYLRIVGAVPGITMGIPSTSVLTERMEMARRNPEWRRRFRTFPLAHLANYRGRNKTGVELTLNSALQDLADLIAMEADDAFHAAYYPRLPHVFFPEERVEALMASLQREVDGEANSRKRVPPQFSSLVWDRQCALAERRRMWFHAFGITSRSWRLNTWSLWRIHDMPCPLAELKAKKLGA